MNIIRNTTKTSLMTIYRRLINGMLTITIIAVLFSGCRKNEYDFDKLNTSGNWGPDIALPLIYSSLTMSKIMADYDQTHITYDGENLCYLVYQNKVVSPYAEQLIIIPNQNINSIVPVTINGGALQPGATSTVNINKTYTFNFSNNESIDSIYIKSGNFIFNLASDLNYDATIVVTLPTVKFNGNPFTQTINLAAGDTPFVPLTLDGYTMVFGSGPTLGENQLPIQYAITIHGNGSPNNSPYSISFNEYFSNIQFSKIFGYLGQFPFNLVTDTVNLKIYNNNLTGYIDFEDPRIYLKLTSSFGMPLRVHVSDFMAKPTHDSPTTVNITGSGVPSAGNPFTLQTVPWGLYGHMISETIYLDRNNSTIYNAMQVSPRFFYCNSSVNTNPAGVSQNFALDTSKFSFDMKVELPMYGRVQNYVLQDTIAFEFESIDELESLQFNIDVDNDFPVDGIAQIYFVDSSYTVLDSLLNPIQSAILAATPGPAPDYLVTQSVRKYTTTTLYEARLKKLKGVKKMLIRAELNSYNDGANLVKIYGFYTIDVKISARAKFKVNY